MRNSDVFEYKFTCLCNARFSLHGAYKLRKVFREVTKYKVVCQRCKPDAQRCSTPEEATAFLVARKLQ